MTCAGGDVEGFIGGCLEVRVEVPVQGEGESLDETAGELCAVGQGYLRFQVGEEGSDRSRVVRGSGKVTNAYPGVAHVGAEKKLGAAMFELNE